MVTGKPRVLPGDRKFPVVDRESDGLIIFLILKTVELDLTGRGIQPMAGEEDTTIGIGLKSMFDEGVVGIQVSVNEWSQSM